RDRSAQSPTGQRLAGRLSACRPAPRPRHSNGRASGLSWGRHNTGQSRRSRVVAAPRSHPAFEGARKWSNPLATVDDDPGVARDLLRRYGPDCRAVRAEWGPQVLEALQETELRVTGRQLTKRGAHSGGAAALVQRLARAGVAEVAIERGDGPVVEAMLAAGVTVVVITPRQVKNLRSRYGAAGNKDDRFDAYVLADVLRADRARLRALARMPRPPSRCGRPAGPARDLVCHRVAAVSQLRDCLLAVFPGAVGLFCELHSAISLAFLARFDCQDRAGWLSEKRLAA